MVRHVEIMWDSLIPIEVSPSIYRQRRAAPLNIPLSCTYSVIEVSEI